MKKQSRALLLALCIPLLALFFFSAWKLYTILSAYKAAEESYDSLSGAVVVSPAVPSPAAAPLESAALQSPEAESDDRPDAESAAERSPLTVDFDALRQIGGGVVGWLCLPDTVLNYPVAQGTDNDYYLTRFIDGSVSTGGSLFVDCLCPSDFSGRHTIIYGHNMRDGSMFALIDDYTDQAFYDEHPVLYLNTPTQNYKLEIFSGFTTDPESFVYTTSFALEADYAAFQGALLGASVIACPTALAPTDRIVTLSTCTYSGEDVRFVVCARLVEID